MMMWITFRKKMEKKMKNHENREELLPNNANKAKYISNYQQQAGLVAVHRTTQSPVPAPSIFPPAMLLPPGRLGDKGVSTSH